MKRVRLLLLALFVAGCGVANASSSPTVTLERIGGEAQLWRFHDDQRANTCYLWGPNGIFCVADHGSQP